MSLQKDSLLTAIRPYRLTTKCFSKYIIWICQNVKQNDLDNYVLLNILKKKDSQLLGRLENTLEKSQCILGITESAFIRMFGFSNDLLIADPEKVHDILAEPLLVVDLDSHGFSSIEKIAQPIKLKGEKIPTADFIATLEKQKFAIELKTVRIESYVKEMEDGQVVSGPAGAGGPALVPSWWRTMFRESAITKIEDKDRKAIAQLENTADHYRCDYKMLVLCTRQLSPSTLMSSTDWREELEFLKNQYPQIDYFCNKSYFGEIVFYPELS